MGKLNRKGDALIYATYLGGGKGDVGNGIAVDRWSNAYLTGHAVSDDFPVVYALQPHLGGPLDAFVAKISDKGRLRKRL